jgi:hypothetical protein
LGAAGPTKDPDDLPGPSLAEILLKRLDEIQAEDAAEAGRPAPAPFDIAEAKAQGKDLGQMLLGRLEIVEEEENNCAVPQPGLDVTHNDEPGTHVPG